MYIRSLTGIGLQFVICVLAYYSAQVFGQESGPADVPGTLTVYVEWIGPSGEERDVQISLECESGEYSGSRYINKGSPDGWEIRGIDPEGILCNVSELVRETFRPDIIDCQGIYILPGRHEECTMVNTKIVKRIEMLNRYGKIVMIVLVLLIGLVAVKRLT
jgi:hypothetical protein